MHSARVIGFHLIKHLRLDSQFEGEREEIWEERNTSCFHSCHKGKVKHTTEAVHFSKPRHTGSSRPLQVPCPSPTDMQHLLHTLLGSHSADRLGTKLCSPEEKYKCRDKEIVCHRSSANLIIWLRQCYIPAEK